MTKVLPQHFFDNPDIRTLLADGHSCILHKRLNNPLWGKEGFVSTHAITFVRRGKLRVEGAEDRLLEVTEGNMVLLPKGIYTVSDILPESGDFEALMFFFEKKTLESFVETLDLPPQRAVTAEPALLGAHPVVSGFVDNLLRTYPSQTAQSRQLAQIKLAELLYLIHSASPDGQFAGLITNLNNRERRSLREFMETNFTRPLSIEDFAYLTGRSVASFRRDFKTQFGGMSPKQWLIDRRLDLAAKILANSITSITEVVQEVGYDNVPHFIKAFGQKFGVSPKQYSIQKRQTLLV